MEFVFEDYRKKVFEPWRQKKIKAFKSLKSAHYFRVEDSVLRSIVSMCQNVISSRVQKGRHRVSVDVTDDLANDILAFVEQVKFAYIHPRSTSARYAMQNDTAYSPRI